MQPSTPDQVRILYEASADSYTEMIDAEIDLPVYEDTQGRLAERIKKLPGTGI